LSCVPCLTLRDSTERPITLKYGHNRLVKCVNGELMRQTQEALQVPRGDGRRPPLWDGQTAPRIVEQLTKEFG